ncbi:hypothetical protein H0H92_007892 [Tricholoma furcatifolium]|nr:hypothetical protein H0H92_007892 [Tricholoma furcatifolium]
MNKPSYKCHRGTHQIRMVGDLLRWSEEMTVMEGGDHKARRNCKCQACKDARDRGCLNPHKCGAEAGSLLNALPNLWNPTQTTPERSLENIDGNILDGGQIFNPNVHTKDSLGKGFRVFTDITRDSLSQPRTAPTWSRSEDKVDAYTDGSCHANGSTEAIAGAGVWFGVNDERNIAIRLPGDIKNSNNTGEAAATLAAVNATPTDATLRIHTDSLITLESLTENLEHLDNDGWIGAANRQILRATVSRLRSRTGYTIFMKVKGHSGDEGNEAADALANEGARSPHTTPLDLSLNPNYSYSGMSLWNATQKVVYAGMLERSPVPTRRTTNANLERMREAIAATTGTPPTNARL